MPKCYFHTGSRLTLLELFDREILRVFARTELLDDHDFCCNLRASKNDFLARYLLQRPHTETTPTNGNFAALMNYVVDELMKYDDHGGSEQLRYQYLKVLCVKVSAQHRITYSVCRKTTRLVSSVENRCHVIIAAIYLEKFFVVEWMLEDEQMDVAEVKSEIFGTPLHAAVQMGRHDLVRVLLQRGANVNMERPGIIGSLLDAAIMTQDEKMVRLLLEPRYGYTTHGRAFEEDIVMSLRSNQPDVAHLLLGRNKHKLSECQYVLQDGLLAACRYGLIEIVQLLLDHGANVNERGSPGGEVGTIEQAAWTGQEEVLLLLLARGANPYGRESGGGSMCAAAWGGHIGAVCILLDAGVELKPRQWAWVLSRAAPRVGSAEMVRLLLDRGIIELNKLDDDLQSAESYLVDLVALACQQGNVGFVEALAQHGFTMNDESLYARHDLPPPIILAMAFRQDHLVQALRKLGVREVDPLDSMIGKDFANGKYPRDPPAPPECTMPWKS